MIELFLKGVKVSPAVSLQSIAENTQGYSGSDMKVLCREIAMGPLRRYIASFGPGVAGIVEANEKGLVSPDDIGEVTWEDVQLGMQRTKKSTEDVSRLEAFDKELGTCILE